MPEKLENLTLNIVSNNHSFAAIKNDKTVITWGNKYKGGDKKLYEFISFSNNEYNYDMKMDVSSNITNIKEIVSTNNAYAALKEDNTVITWGEFKENVYTNGDISDALILTNVIKLYSSETTFVALKDDGTIYNWGGQTNNNITDLSGEIVVDIYSTFGSDQLTNNQETLAALTDSGKVVTWGNQIATTENISELTSGVIDIIPNSFAFCGLKYDNTGNGTYKVIAWGEEVAGGDYYQYTKELNGSWIQRQNQMFELQSNVIKVVGSTYSPNNLFGDGAFCALKLDGSVITWGSAYAGGDKKIWKSQTLWTEDMSSELNVNVLDIYAGNGCFIAIKDDGSVISWGWHTSSGNDINNRGSNIPSEITNYKYFKYTDISNVIHKNIKYLDTFQTHNFKNAQNGDILLDVSSNIWAEYSSNNWTQIGNINIVNEIPTEQLYNNDLHIDLTSKTILLYNGNLLKEREIISWEEINKNEVQFYPTIYADSSRNHLFRFDNTLEPSGNEIGWEINNTSIENRNNMYIDVVRDSNYLYRFHDGEEKWKTDITIDKITSLPTSDMSYNMFIDQNVNKVFFYDQDNTHFKPMAFIEAEHLLWTMGAKENDFHIELDESGNSILYQFDASLNLLYPEKDINPNDDGILTNNSTTYPIENRMDNLITEINKLDGLYAYKKIPDSLGSVYIKALKDQYHFDISWIKQSGYYGNITNVGRHVRREDFPKYTTINEVMVDMINKINEQDKIIQAKVIYNRFDENFNNPKILLTAHPDNEDDIFFEEFDLSGAELNVDITDVSYNFNPIRDYYMVKTGETVNGVTEYDDELILPTNNDLNIYVRYDISGQDPTWEYYPEDNSLFPFSLERNKRFTEISFSNKEWNDTTGHLRFNLDNANRWSEIIHKDTDNNMENCIRYKKHWQIDVSFNIDHFKYSHEKQDIWLNKNISLLDSSFPLEENDLGDGKYSSVNNFLQEETSLYNFETFTFRNCNQTGIYGPSLSTMKSYYNTYQDGNTTNSWVNNTTFLNQMGGQQVWTVPRTASYRIEAYGAAGCGGNNHASPQNTVTQYGGYGAKISGVFQLTQGEQIRILVGQMGTGFSSYGHRPGAGGGGTFVMKSPYNTEASILLIAGGGGGGGQGDYGQPDGGDAYTETHNSNTGNAGQAGDRNAYYSCAGAGFWGNGSGHYSHNSYGYANNNNSNSGRGGDSYSYSNSDGGFGGGGGASLIPGGGGGYSGGNTTGSWSSWGQAYGGASYNSGIEQYNSVRANGPGGNGNDKHGYVIIQSLAIPITYKITTSIPEYNSTSNQIMCNTVVKNINSVRSFDLSTLKSQKKFVYDAKTWTELFTKSPYLGEIPLYFAPFPGKTEITAQEHLNTLTNFAGLTGGGDNEAKLGTSDETFFSSFNERTSNLSFFLYDGKMCTTSYLIEQFPINEMSKYGINTSLINQLNEEQNNSNYRWAYLRYKMPNPHLAQNDIQDVTTIRVVFGNEDRCNIPNLEEFTEGHCVTYVQLKVGETAKTATINGIPDGEGNNTGNWKWLNISTNSTQSGWSISKAVAANGTYKRANGIGINSPTMGTSDLWTTATTSNDNSLRHVSGNYTSNSYHGMVNTNHMSDSNNEGVRDLWGAFNKIPLKHNENIYAYLAIGIKNNKKYHFKKPMVYFYRSNGTLVGAANGFMNFEPWAKMENTHVTNQFKTQQTDGRNYMNYLLPNIYTTN